MIKLKHLIILCCLTAFASQALAQGTISGRVFDSKSGKAVEYATVAVLKASDSSMVAGTISQSNGSFTTKAAYGSYIVRVSFMGYTTYFHPKNVVLTAKSPSANLGKILITPGTMMMDEVVVSAERTMVEYQLDKRVVNVDKNLVTSGGTATEVLQNVPSVSVDNDGNVTLRGSSNVKVLINGRPYELMGNDLETLLEQIPASTVESVEVITNPSAKYDPEGMSGIINLKLKEKTAAALGLNGMVNLNGTAPLPFMIPEQMPQFIPSTMGSINLNYTTEKYNLFFTLDGGMRSRGSVGHSNIERLRNGAAWSHDSLDQYSIRRNYMGSMKIGGEYYFNDKNSLLLSYQMRGGLRNRTSQIFSTDLLHENHLLDYEQLDTNHNRNINHSFNLSYIKKFDEKDRELTADAKLHYGQGASCAAYLTICVDVNRYHHWTRQRGCDEPYNNFLWLMSGTVDASLFAQNICVAAESEGLGFCFLGTVMYNAAPIAQLLNLPKGVVPVITLSLGYPDEQPAQSERLPLDGIVHNETYHDYSDEDIDRIHELRENFPFNQEMVRQNGTRNLAEIFTKLRYPKKDNEAISKSLHDFCKQAGMME